MIIKKWIILGIAVAAILTYVVGIPPSISAEYSKTKKEYTAQTNDCGNADNSNSHLGFMSSDYESLSENVFCANTDSQIQGEENSIGIASTQR